MRYLEDAGSHALRSAREMYATVIRRLGPYAYDLPRDDFVRVLGEPWHPATDWQNGREVLKRAWREALHCIPESLRGLQSLPSIILRTTPWLTLPINGYIAPGVFAEA